MIFTYNILERAYLKICKKRKNYSSNNDIWELRLNWEAVKPELLKALNAGLYQFSSARQIIIQNTLYDIWDSKDAVVIESLSILLKERYNITSNSFSFHIKDKGGVKAAVCKIRNNFMKYNYVAKTDVKSYYASIVHIKLYKILQKYIGETCVLCLLYQFMNRTVYRNGYFKNINKGICRGTSLSPLLGALYLEELDMAMSKNSSFYIRYMDDILILTKSHWVFRRLIRKVNMIFKKLELTQVEKKTFIGKIERGFDFPGFHFYVDGMRVSKKSVRKFAENIVLRLACCRTCSGDYITRTGAVHKCRAGSAYGAKQFWEQNKMKGESSIPEAVSVYIQRWLIWVNSIYEKERTGKKVYS